MAGPTTIPFSAPPASPPAPAQEWVPRLENGDRLTRAEFERIYSALPRVNKAELIEGVVHMPSPVSVKHSCPHADFLGLLVLYRASTPGVLVGNNGTVRLDTDNEVQPDAYLMLDPARSGQARISPENYIEGAPELVAEIARSSASMDLHDKLRVYRRNGVREYIVWRVEDSALDWFVLRAGRYDPLPVSPEGIHKSEVFPGLWLDVAALLRGDLARVKAVLEQGLASPEHAQFAARLPQPA